MELWVKTALIAAGVAIVALGLAGWVGYRRQQGSFARLVDGLVRAPNPQSAIQVNLKELDDLPMPVKRYFRRVLQDGQSRIRAACFTQVGTLRTDLQNNRWLPFEASQIVVPPSIGFVWNARVDIAFPLHIRVRDALLAGQGSGQVSLLSAFTVASAGGSLEMNSGALHRYLAEAVWYPTALLPSPRVQWRAIDNKKALVTLTDNGVAVSLEFWFNDADEVIGIYTPGRWGRFDGGYKHMAWEGHFAKYEARSGMLIPMEGEVGWYSEGKWQPVWRGVLTHVSYELAR